MDYFYQGFDSSINSFGSAGIIQIPSAENFKEGEVRFTFNKNSMYKFGSITVSPFNWMDATYFYYRPSDLWWTGPGTEGLYIDKGFNVKFSKYFRELDIDVALGLDDFAGTGLFSREYILATKTFEFFKFTAGLGWGAFADNNGYKNPLAYVSKSFDKRNYNNANFIYVGKPSYSNWFKGNVNLIFGFEYIPKFFKNTKFKFEYDSFDYLNGFSTLRSFTGQNPKFRRKDSDFNFGISYKLNESSDFELSWLNGNQLNFSLSIGLNFAQRKVKKESLIDRQNKKDIVFNDKNFYEDLLTSMANKSLYLQTAHYKENKLEVAVTSSSYNALESHKITGHLSTNLAELYDLSLDEITTIGVNVGYELYRISSPSNYFNENSLPIYQLARYNSKIKSGQESDYESLPFRPMIQFPQIFSSIEPSLISHIGDPEKFFFGGMGLNLRNEIQFSRNIILNSEAYLSISDNFDKKKDRPDSKLPHVRTDLVKYLQESDHYINQLQLNYYFNPRKSLFGKISSGILESMYGGTGIELLYKPFSSNFSFGIEGYSVRKRDFDRTYKFLKYKVDTGHLNFNYYIPATGIFINLSYGKYLAGDLGYTLDLSRRLKSGFKAGFFFTRTNVSAELFGEGSFDKGFYFEVPLNLISKYHERGKIDFQLRPLTRDGGAKLNPGNSLSDIFYDNAYHDIDLSWSEFYD